VAACLLQKKVALLENFWESERMASAIVVRDLTKYYGRKVAIQKLNFEVQSGHIVGFLGPNGAGKSTTLRILCGLIPASSGCVYIHGLSVTTRIKQIKQSMGYMPESNPLPEDMRVEEYLKFRARIKQIPHRLLKTCVWDALERCDLHRIATKKMIGALSKGFKQRVGIAEALLGQPKVIILDEPTIGLDPHQILGIRDLLKKLRGETTVVFSSHILPEVEAACTHLIILNQGQIVANDTSENLRKQYFQTTRYEVTLVDENGHFPERLSHAPVELCLKKSTAHGDQRMTYAVETESTEEGVESQLTRWIFENNWPLIQFVKKEPDLESLFLKLTSVAWKKIDNERL
jgi:ABC-2 type transport system ATP-binding protein